MRSAVKRYVSEAIRAIEPSRYQQEPSYIAGLAGRLHGVAYDGKDARVSFESTVVGDRGPGSVESWSGVDLAITASISDARSTIRKAILVQAKLGQASNLAVDDLTRLLEQIGQMKQLTRSPQVMEILEERVKLKVVALDDPFFSLLVPGFAHSAENRVVLRSDTPNAAAGMSPAGRMIPKHEKDEGHPIEGLHLSRGLCLGSSFENPIEAGGIDGFPGICSFDI